MHNLISENQTGFKEQSRTSDHIFTLKSITEKEKVYAAFILEKILMPCGKKVYLIKRLLLVSPMKSFKKYIPCIKIQCRIKFSSGVDNEFFSICGV